MLPTRTLGHIRCSHSFRRRRAVLLLVTTRFVGLRLLQQLLVVVVLLVLVVVVDFLGSWSRILAAMLAAIACRSRWSRRLRARRASRRNWAGWSRSYILCSMMLLSLCVCVSGSSRGVCYFVYVAIIVFDIFSFCTRTFCFLD